MLRARRARTERLADAGFVPVLGSLGGDAQGAVFNINADSGPGTPVVVTFRVQP